MARKYLSMTLLIAVFGLSLCPNKTQKVYADNTNGYRVEEVFHDKFNKEDLDPSWKLNDATLEYNYSGLHCVSPVPYGSGPIINAATLADRTQINFTIYPLAGQDAGNISFNIGMESPSTPQKEPDVDCKVQFWDDQLVFTDWQNNLEVDHSKEQQHVLRGFNNLFTDLVRTDISLYIERKSANKTQIYAEYRRDGEIVYSNESMPFELLSPRQPYGYCGCFWDAVEMDLTNFEFINNDKLVFQDNLETNTLTYPSTDPSLGNFHINDSLNESNCYYAKVSSVKMDNANESIVNSNELVKLENVTTPYEMNYSIKVNALKENSFFGFGFNIGESTSIDKKNAIGFIKNDNLTADVVILRDGVVDRSNNYQIALAKITNKKYQDYSISFDASNNAYLSVNGLTYKFANIDYRGKTGIGLVNLNGSESSDAELKKFTISRNVYNKYSSEDASNDFSGVKIPDETDPTFTEPYINNQKYSLGSGVSLNEDWVTGIQTLSFANAGPYSRFGYSKEYSEWICEFDVELLSFTGGHMFGLSFGRKSLFDVLLQASTSNSTYLFRYDGAGYTAETTYGANCQFDDGKTYRTFQGINMFDPENNKYHIMFVGKNRTVYVYFKAVDAPDSELSILRSKVSNVNIDGYVSIVGNNGISFNVSNYKMVNLSDECTQESELTLRESFSDANKISDKIALNGTSKVEDGKLVINGSNIKTTSQNLYEMIRFSTDEIENDLEIAFSENKKIIFKTAQNKIDIVEDETVSSYSASEANLKNVKGKRFEITIQGNKISIGYKGFYDPLDKLSQTFINHTLASELSKDYITFSSEGKAVLDDLYLFSLDNSKQCNSYDYEDDPNNAPMWIVKPDFDPSKVYKYEEGEKEPEEQPKKGCKGAASSLSVIFALIGLIALKKKKEVK